MQKNQQPLPTGLPRTIRYARIIIAIQVYRLVGLVLVPPLQNGNLPATLVVPAAVGDSLTAITAPILAFALGRGGLKTWAAALVWNALGLADLVNAVTLGYLTGSSSYLINNLALLFIGVSLGFALHIAATALLLRKQTTNYLLRV